MKKANSINKALLFFFLLFIGIAALSFTAFRETQSLCSDAKRCCQSAPPKRNGGQMVWDDFSRHFLSFVSLK